MLAGTGLVRAVGGYARNSRPGGGGRIALVLTNPVSGFSAVSNRFRVASGANNTYNQGVGAAGDGRGSLCRHQRMASAQWIYSLGPASVSC